MNDYVKMIKQCVENKVNINGLKPLQNGNCFPG